MHNNLHSYYLTQVFEAPRAGEICDMGGDTYANCSVLEAIYLGANTTGKRMAWSLDEEIHTGDHTLVYHQPQTVPNALSGIGAETHNGDDDAKNHRITSISPAVKSRTILDKGIRVMN